MALTQVRIKLNGVWTNLTYNSATGRYEGKITSPAPGTYNLDLEVSNSSSTAAASGTTFPALRLVSEDKTGPVLTVTAPANGLVTAASSVAVSGTVTDNVGVQSLTVNGAAVTVGAGGAWSATVSLAAGGNTITIVAADTSGNKTTVTRSVTKATAGPTLAVTSPAAGVTNQANVTVSGTVSDPVSSVTGVTVNGKAAALSGGTFSAPLTLSEGANTITVIAANAVGLTTTKVLSVTLDTVPPTISLITPTAGELTSDAEFVVAGTVSDLDTGVASVTVNGVPAAVTGLGFAAVITLAEGLNTITATAADLAGNTAVATGTVILDTIPPALVVTSPPENLITNQPALTVSGTASDSGSGLESVTVNGQEAPVSGGVWSLGITLQEGSNAVTVAAKDRVGNTTTVTRQALLDTQDPVLELVSPPAGWLNTNTPQIVFQASDEEGGSGVDMSTVQITLDGAAQSQGVTVSGDTITFAPAQLGDGRHVIAVTVRDRAGNERGLSVSYTVDTLPPELYLLQPDAHRVVDTQEVTVSGWAFDAGSGVASVSAGGRQTTPDEFGWFSFPVPLDVGENTITVTARDGAGLETGVDVYMIRLITDRMEADSEAILALIQRPVWEWTSQELAWYNGAIIRGAYNDTDLNRVGTAVQYLTQALAAKGYDTLDTHPKTDWMEYDKPQWTQLESYLADIAAIRDAQGLEALAALPLPATMRSLSGQGANQIERALVETDSAFPHYFAWTAGELSAGMD